MDALSNILGLLNLRASVYFHSRFCGSWSMASDDSHRSTFHLIARGNCWLQIPELDKRIVLRAGDLIVFPRNIHHAIGYGEKTQEGDALGKPDIDPAAPSTSLVCGYFDFESPQANPILNAMPEVIHLKNEDMVESAMLDGVLRFITAETEADEPGSDVVVDRLSEILFIHVIRAYIHQQGIETGLLAALSDARLARAIKGVQDDPAYPWSVSTLAQKAGMSRSAFAGHFLQVSGITPMQYVTNWRMQVAFEQLRKTSQSVAQIAVQSGYQTEASFRKAFKKQMGIGPGAVRRGMTRS